MILAKLLHLANRCDYGDRYRFYAVKKRLLHRYGTRVGKQIQHIVHKCWGSYDERCGPLCRRCDGTGIYSEFWCVLEKWEWGEFSFHIPVDRVWVKPDASVDIEGRIAHENSGFMGLEAALWLYLLSGEFKEFLSEICSGWSYSNHAYPLLSLQKFVSLVMDDWQRTDPKNYAGQPVPMLPWKKEHLDIPF